MSMRRICPNCYRNENIRANFGDIIESERKFHSDKWCNCGYNSPEEMMADQDMGFLDPKWIPIAKYFIDNYHLRIKQGEIKSKEELVRFFLKLLKSSANNIHSSIELIPIKENEKWEFIYHGRPDKKPRTDIFENEKNF
jgi:hypothetical protein